MEEFAKQLVKGVGCGNAGLDYKRNIKKATECGTNSAKH
jgi:hypothetical protein